MKKDPLPPPTANLATAIIGFWKLKSREDVDATGKVHIDPFLGRDPLGILCFGKTHFSAQFMKRDRSGQETVLQPLAAKKNTARVTTWVRSGVKSKHFDIWRAVSRRLVETKNPTATRPSLLMRWLLVTQFRFPLGGGR
jgi:hypothetical protein